MKEDSLDPPKFDLNIEITNPRHNLLHLYRPILLDQFFLGKVESDEEGGFGAGDVDF